MSTSNISKYLTKYAEPDIELLGGFPAEYDHVIVIPVYAEDCGILSSLLTDIDEMSASVLLVMVLNESDERSTIHPKNAAFLSALHSNYPSRWCREHLTLYDCANTGVLLVNRCKSDLRLPSKEGVGAARKIGCDIAVALHQAKKLSHGWLYNTDADAQLPHDYLRLGESDDAAQIYRFSHVPESRKEDAVHQATLLYELSLHSYVAGLQMAGSPYAYHTVGSTIAVHMDAYVAVRGFPRRAAAEDFYMLNKLAKIGEIKVLDGDPVRILSRQSDRTPFGTGPAVHRIQSGLDGAYQCFYPLAAFAMLRQCLCDVSESIKTGRPLDNIMIGELPPRLANRLPQVVAHAVEKYEGFAPRMLHVREWLDAGKTLQMVNFFRHSLGGPVSLNDWWKQMSEKTGLIERENADAHSMAVQMRRIVFSGRLINAPGIESN